MPECVIRYQKKVLTTKTFRNHLYIVQPVGGGELFWEADEEQGLTRRGGEIHIWITYAGPQEAKISFVRPDWRMILDGIPFEKGFYVEVDVSSKTVELEYEEYSFTCWL